MNTFAICSLTVKDILPESFTQYFLFKEKNILVGLLDIPKTNYKNKVYRDSVVVKIKAFSCNFRDRVFFLLFHQKCIDLSKDKKLYYSPFGSDFVAEVIECGKNVKKFAVGDRVIPNASYPYRLGSKKIGGIPTNYASQRIHVFDKNQLIKVPFSMSDEIASSFTITAQTAYSIIRKLHLKPKENILITAPSSNISLALIRILQNKNVNIYALASSLSHQEDLLKLGVSYVFLVSDLINKEKIFELTKGNLFNAIFDPFYNVYMEKVIPFVAMNGRYITCGLEPMRNPQTKISDMAMIMEHCMINNISLIGNCLGTTADLQTALNDFETKKFDILIDSVYNENDILMFLQKSFGIKERLGKVVYKYLD
ncbi:quinone oxidoreductase family protein [Parabacteroides pacaensis]|uniref:quinone oxidoreductase family protein n=1 Tax=Parabacteroides pacaensis TaxID=2086575 RepID=UPI000D103C06|nr:zinc-binding alcohol dehydrogenase family protein [Parabacteroides pacaensis]